MQISQSETFKNEYRRITKFIDETNDTNIKNQIQSLLNELISYVKKIDNFHSDLVNIGKLPDDMSEARGKIVETRKKIFKIIENN